MKKIAELVAQIDEELCGAKDYAEAYVYHKATGSPRASVYKSMAGAELEHAMLLHGFAAEDIEKVGTVFKAPTEMQEAWDKSHREYVDKTAWIKQMLNM